MACQAYRGKFARKLPFWVKTGLIIAVFVTPFSVMAAGDDDYLSALKQAVKRVGERDVAPEGGASAGESGDNAVSRDTFEAELREQYVGSSVFYGKLSEADQEGIFLEYQEGAAISELRKKIMDRFLHR